MKKIFTFIMLCALSLAAVGQTAIIAGKPHSAKEKLEAIKAERTQKNLTLSKINGRHAIEQEKQSYVPRTIAPIAQLPSSNQEDVVTLNFTSLDDFTYQTSTGDWFLSMSCMDMDKPEFGYMVKFDYFAPADNCCGNFVYDDLDLHYSYMFTPEGTTTYGDVELRVSKQPISSNEARLIVDAEILGNDGIRYKVNCVHELVSPADTVNTIINNVNLTKNDYDFTLAGKSDLMDAKLLVRSNRVKGLHTADIDVMNSYFIYNGDTLVPMTLSADIMPEQVDGVATYVANLNLVTTDTVQYIITMMSPLPTPTVYVDVVCTNLTIDESLSATYGNVYAEAKNEDWEILGIFPGRLLMPGQYTSGVEFYITNNYTWDQVEALFIDVNVSIDDNDNWVLTGTLHCSDNAVYNLCLTWEPPKADKVVKVTYDTPATVFFTPEENYKLEFMNEKGTYFCFIEVAGVLPGVPFGSDKVNISNSFLMNNDTWDMPQISEVNGVVEQKGDTTKIIASLICFDRVQYDVEMYYAVPTPTQTVEYTLEGEFLNMIESMGAFQVMAYTPDSLFAITLAPQTERIEGTYINDGLFGKLGQDGGHFDFIDDFTYVATYDSNSHGLVKRDILKGQMTVTVDDQGILIALVDVICDDAVRYVLTITCDMNKKGLEFDAENGSIDHTYTSNDIVDINQTTDQYGEMILFTVTSADGSNMMSLLFFTDELDSDIVIPEGNYPINDSELSGTVLANPGVGDNGVFPSFYANCNGNGSLTIPLYLFVDGNVEVSKKNGQLYMEVNALNSYEVPVHVIYDAGTISATENVAAKDNRLIKIIKDNQLIIKKHGLQYNVLGTVVK